MNAKELRTQANDLRVNAKSKRQESLKFAEKADGRNKLGDDSKAGVWQSQAATYNQEADDLERHAMAKDEEARVKESRGQEIEQQQAQMTAEYKSKMDALEKEKKDLLGGPVTLF